MRARVQQVYSKLVLTMDSIPGKQVFFVVAGACCLSLVISLGLIWHHQSEVKRIESGMGAKGSKGTSKDIILVYQNEAACKEFWATSCVAGSAVDPGAETDVWVVTTQSKNEEFRPPLSMIEADDRAASKR
jgi:hypothetical protein